MLLNKQNRKSSLRVCVVGAGAAGICAARRVVEELPGAEVCVFEQSDQLGGTWVFTEQSFPETHSSMYAGLRTIIPKEIMTFSGFPIKSVDFPDHHNPDESFPRHEVILSYLQRFAEPIKHLIQYNLRIVSIVPVGRKELDNSEFKWRINAERVPPGKQKFAEYFDVVFVCTGHYWCPRIPDFANKFRTTRWAHSHSYRRAQHFAGMRVAVVGANLSGVEIALQLTEHVEKVYLINSSQKTVIEKSALANSLLELNGSRVVDVVDDSLVLADGRMIGGLDFVLFCTGYCFNFPFFDQSQNSSVIFCDGNLVSPLIGHVAHPDYLKALFFIGLNLLVDPFPCFDVQTHFALALLKDRVPNASERFTLEVAKHWEEKRIKRMNADKIAQKYFHKLGPDQWEYFDWLNSLSGFKPLPKVVEHIYKRNVELKSENSLTYRNFRYRIVDEQKFRTELPK